MAPNCKRRRQPPRQFAEVLDGIKGVIFPTVLRLPSPYWNYFKNGADEDEDSRSITSGLCVRCAHQREEATVSGSFRPAILCECCRQLLNGRRHIQRHSLCSTTAWTPQTQTPTAHCRQPGHHTGNLYSQRMSTVQPTNRQHKPSRCNNRGDQKLTLWAASPATK